MDCIPLNETYFSFVMRQYKIVKTIIGIFLFFILFLMRAAV